jgi:hypothetical protein
MMLASKRPICLEAEGFEIRIPAGTRSRLAVLAERFEMVWATSWESDAHLYLVEPLELEDEDWRSIEWTVTSASRGETWKLHDVRQYVESRPCVWIDDDLHADAYRWAEDRTVSGIPTVLIDTDPEEGLTDDQLEQAVEFALRVA